MPRKRRCRKPSRKSARLKSTAGEETLLRSEFLNLQGKLNKLAKVVQSLEESSSDLTIHVNLITRLLTILCIEKFGMRVGVLKRLIKRIEKETIRDSQISHLENLYNLPQNQDGKAPGESQLPPTDPWDQVS